MIGYEQIAIGRAGTPRYRDQRQYFSKKGAPVDRCVSEHNPRLVKRSVQDASELHQGGQQTLHDVKFHRSGFPVRGAERGSPGDPHDVGGSAHRTPDAPRVEQLDAGVEERLHRAATARVRAVADVVPAPLQLDSGERTFRADGGARCRISESAGSSGRLPLSSDAPEFVHGLSFRVVRDELSAFSQR